MFILLWHVTLLLVIFGHCKEIRNTAETKGTGGKSNTDDTEVSNTTKERTTSPDDDQSWWPGHMKPLAASKRGSSIDVHKGYPTPVDFLNNYAAPYLPVLLEAAEQSSTPFQRWQNTTYFTILPQSLTHWTPLSQHEDTRISFREYLSVYADNGSVFNHEIPHFLRDDVTVPKCLLCEPILSSLSKHRLWISHKEHTSNIQRRNEDTIHCTYVGRQDFTLISHIEYGDKIPSDFGNIDVKRVDLKKYPSLREVEYHKVRVNAGDCIYIPTKWYWQVNSYGKTYTVDIQWYHRMKSVKVGECKPKKEVSHINSVSFKDVSDASSHETDVVLHYFASYLITIPKFTYKTFERHVKKDKKLMEDLVEWTEELTEITQQVFKILDANSDQRFSLSDLQVLNKTLLEDIRGLLIDRVRDYEDVLQDQQDEQKNTPKEDVTDTEKPDNIMKNAVDDYLKNYISQMEDVLRESINEMAVTGKLPDIKQRFAQRQAQDSKNPEIPSDSKSEERKPLTERQKAKAKLKLEREKKRLDEKEAAMKHEEAKQEDYVIIDDSLEEEIVADDEDDLNIQQSNVQKTNKDKTDTTKDKHNTTKDKHTTTKDKTNPKKDKSNPQKDKTNTRETVTSKENKIPNSPDLGHKKTEL